MHLKEEISEDVMNDTSYVKVAEFLSEYVQHLRNGNGSLSTLWVSNIDI